MIVQAAAHLFQQTAAALRALDVVGQRHVDTVWLGGVKPVEAMHVTVLAAGILGAEIRVPMRMDGNPSGFASAYAFGRDMPNCADSS